MEDLINCQNCRKITAVRLGCCAECGKKVCLDCGRAIKRREGSYCADCAAEESALRSNKLLGAMKL